MCVWKIRGAYRVWVAMPGRRRKLEDLCGNENIIIKWIFKKWD
jgi:hypothetical protein